MANLQDEKSGIKTDFKGQEILILLATQSFGFLAKFI
jgi:hypothetical protein